MNCSNKPNNSSTFSGLNPLLEGDLSGMTEARIEWITRPLDSSAEENASSQEDDDSAALQAALEAELLDSDFQLRDGWQWFGNLLDNAKDDDFLPADVHKTSGADILGAEKLGAEKSAATVAKIENPNAFNRWFNYRRSFIGAISAAACLIAIVMFQQTRNDPMAPETVAQVQSPANSANLANSAINPVIIPAQPAENVLPEDEKLVPADQLAADTDSSEALNKAQSYLEWTDEDSFDSALSDLEDSFAEYSPGGVWNSADLAGYTTINESFSEWKTDCSGF